jgi:hypothetical protein
MEMQKWWNSLSPDWQMVITLIITIVLETGIALVWLWPIVDSSDILKEDYLPRWLLWVLYPLIGIFLGGAITLLRFQLLFLLYHVGLLAVRPFASDTFMLDFQKRGTMERIADPIAQLLAAAGIYTAACVLFSSTLKREPQQQIHDWATAAIASAVSMSVHYFLIKYWWPILKSKEF